LLAANGLYAQMWQRQQANANELPVSGAAMAMQPI
jgi:hypothetical protein